MPKVLRLQKGVRPKFPGRRPNEMGQMRLVCTYYIYSSLTLLFVFLKWGICQIASRRKIQRSALRSSQFRCGAAIWTVCFWIWGFLHATCHHYIWTCQVVGYEETYPMFELSSRATTAQVKSGPGGHRSSAAAAVWVLVNCWSWNLERCEYDFF